LRGFKDRHTGDRRSLEYIMEHHPEELGLIEEAKGKNTTITAVIVNKKIPATELAQFGRQIHTSMAQVIRPFHTPFDGDILFSICVSEEPLGYPASIAAEFASKLAREALYRAVIHD
jgi:6-aminohexanoate-oligomer endohydrolase